MIYKLLSAILVIPALFSSAQPQAAQVDGMHIAYLNSIPYVSIVELAELYNIRIEYFPVSLTTIASRGEHRLTVTHDSRFASIDDKQFNLIAPVLLIRGAAHLPIPAGLDLFSELLPGALRWNERSRTIESDGGMFTIASVSVENLANGSLLQVKLTEPLDCSITQADKEWLNITIPNGSFDQNTIHLNNASNLVSDVRGYQYDGEAMLSFRLTGNVDSYSISDTSPDNVIAIALFEKRQPDVAADYQTPSSGISVAPAPDDQLWRIDTIIIDPGHGGKDPGAVGPSGALEKDIVLAVARELKNIIDQHGEITTVMTRDDDTFIPLWERSRIANANHGKLFISIHANSHRNRSASGMEIYFLSAAKTDDAKEVARRENAVIQFEEDLQHYDIPEYSNSILQDLMEIQLDMTSNVFLKESQDMCSILLDTAVASTRQHSRGVKQAGFQVMIGTQSSMPSVLFEIGFISNPAEETNLKRTSYQKRLAQSMFDAIILFKTRHERGLFSRSQ